MINGFILLASLKTLDHLLIRRDAALNPTDSKFYFVSESEDS